MTNEPGQYEHTVHYLYRLQKHGIKLGLSNTRRLMEIMGNPQNTFRCIHIAGTNGKGSTASLIASVLKESGLKTGLFTSPHLISFTERISIDDTRITETEVVTLASQVRASFADTDLNPTFFEFVTAMAFKYFADNHIDWAVVETGMGGRLDATNVIRPEVSVITNISLDHCEFLGNTISDITFEKAGIIKPGVPLITTSRDPEVIRQLSGISADMNSVIHVYDKDFKGRIKEMDDRHITIDYTGFHEYVNVSIPLSGRYQLYNACASLRTCEVLKAQGVPLTDISIKRGLEHVRLEGRLEWVSDSPPILLDGAHNPDASRSLAASLKELFSDRKIILVAGIMGDKDIKEILSPLAGIADTVILTKAQYERAASSERLSGIISSINNSEINRRPASIISTDSVTEAVRQAKSLCTGNSIILITGSFYTAGEAKEVLGHKAVLSRLRE